MIIKFHNVIDTRTTKLCYQLAVWMESATAIRSQVFAASMQLISGGNACLFSVKIKGKLIGLGLLSYGDPNTKLRKLVYFSVNPDHRGIGLGAKILTKALTQEAKAGCIVPCISNLMDFYSSIGFEYVQESEGHLEGEVIMARASGYMSAKQLVASNYKIIEFNPHGLKPEYLKGFEEKYGFELIEH